MTSDIKIKILLGLLVQVVLYGGETWVLRKTKVLRMEIFERKIMRRLFDPCKDFQSSDWKRLHSVNNSKMGLT